MPKRKLQHQRRLLLGRRDDLLGLGVQVGGSNLTGTLRSPEQFPRIEIVRSFPQADLEIEQFLFLQRPELLAHRVVRTAVKDDEFSRRLTEGPTTGSIPLVGCVHGIGGIRDAYNKLFFLLKLGGHNPTIYLTI